MAKSVTRRPKPEPTIAELSDRLNELFTRVEALFASDPVAVSTLLTEPPSPDDNVTEFLAFRKVGSKWGLYVVYLDEDMDEVAPPTPITSAPRRTRVRAAALVPVLRAKAEAQRSEDKDAVSNACDILAAELLLDFPGDGFPEEDPPF